MQSWQPRTNACCDFSSHLCKVLHLPRKSEARSYEGAAPVTQNHLSKPEDLMLQNATRLRKSAPWPPNISDGDVSCTAPAPRKCTFAKVQRIHCAWHGKMMFKSGPKMVVPLRCFTSKHASRHSRVQLLISHPARSLCTRRFSRAYFSSLWSRKTLEKRSVSGTFLPFRAFWLIFFLLTLSSPTFPTSVAASVHMSEVWLQKLPSVICVHWPWLP